MVLQFPLILPFLFLLLQLFSSITQYLTEKAFVKTVCVLHSCTQIALQFRGRHIQMIVGYLFQCVVLKLSG